MKKLEEGELVALIEQLKKRGIIVVNNENISYKPPISQP